MTSVRTIRWLRACLLGLFVVAQVAGVVPLMRDHALNVYEIVPVAAHGHHHARATLANPDGDHHHGLLDLHDQCCALHTLAGPLPSLVDVGPAVFARMRVPPVAVAGLTGGNPFLLDRPPKPVLPI